MNLFQNVASTINSLLGHGDHPMPVSLPLGAWAIGAVSDALATATGEPIYDAAGRYAIGVGLAGTAGSMLTGFLERRSNGTTVRGHESGIAAHAVGGLLVGGLYAASLALRVQAHSEGKTASPLARGLAVAGGGIALANALYTHRLSQTEHQERGRARLNPSSPLGVHPTPL